MANLLTTLSNSSTALNVFNQALDVTQNNVVNASTPGYARQELKFEAQPFDPSVGLPGGVLSGGLQNTRDAYTERTVQQQQSSLGAANAASAALTSVQSLFSLDANSGLSAKLDSFFASFSALSVSPNDPTARQTVLSQAGQVAQAFQTAATGLVSQQAGIDGSTQQTVTSINALAQDIAQITSGGSATQNAGTDARLNSDLEQLSQLTGFTALQQPGGSLNIYVGGQTPLVLGGQVFALKAITGQAQTSILDANGKDVTSQITSGQLGGELKVRNQSIPGYASSLNSLAQGFADQVNTALNAGLAQGGASPNQNLFIYNTGVDAASTIALTNITPDQIAGASAGAPGGNGNATAVAGLAQSGQVNGQTFSQFYANLSAQVGRDVSSAGTARSSAQDVLTQAQTLRQQSSGVSLDQEATQLIQYQRSYEAVSKLITVLDQLTGDLMNILQ